MKPRRNTARLGFMGKARRASSPVGNTGEVQAMLMKRERYPSNWKKIALAFVRKLLEELGNVEEGD